MAPTFKQMTDFFISIGADQVEHTEKGYLAHAIGVHSLLRSWGCNDDVCRGGLFHSIYGTEFFQEFTLPTERREDMQALIGERAERLAYCNCAMDRASFDQAVRQADEDADVKLYQFGDRITGETIQLDQRDFDDLCTIHLCDWVEQAPRSQSPNYRTEAYRQLAQRLGGVAQQAYQQMLEKVSPR